MPFRNVPGRQGLIQVLSYQPFCLPVSRGKTARSTISPWPRLCGPRECPYEAGGGCRNLIKYRMDQANKAIEDALCLEAGKGSPHSIINSTYYAMFYAVLALLLREGKSYAKHSGVIGAFYTTFVRTGLLPGMPHPVARRGSDRLPTFFCDDDYPVYLAFRGTPYAASSGYLTRCLIPNPVPRWRCRMMLTAHRGAASDAGIEAAERLNTLYNTTVQVSGAHYGH